MLRSIRGGWSLTLALALAACVSQPLQTSARRPAATGTASPVGSKPAASAAITPASMTTAPATPALPAGKTTLSGTVRVPVAIATAHGGIISDAGALIISDAGGLGLGQGQGNTIIGNNGSSYRLFDAPAQDPIARAQVAVLDAAGKPVMGADGKPLVTTTDAKGTYSFDQALPGDNLVVSVTLGNNAGQLAAIAPPGATRQADVDVVSTLTTGYILDQYVKTQADPVKTLDRLPANVEADTRAKAATAVASGKVPLPDALTSAKVVATLEALRKSDAALDAQMDAVKRLLIPAGQSDLGNGQVATSVDLGAVLHLTVAPTGDLIVATTRVEPGSAAGLQGRIWRLGSDGHVSVALDDKSPYINGPGNDGNQTLLFRMFGTDPAGHVLLLDLNGDVGRLETDGSVTRLAHVADANGPIAADAQGRVWSIERLGTNDPKSKLENLQLVTDATGASPQPHAVLQGVSETSVTALTPDGHATVYDVGSRKWSTYDPVADTWTTQPFTPDNSIWSVDAAGHVYEVDPKARTLVERLADGTSKPIMASLPAEMQLELFTDGLDLGNLEVSQVQACAAPDGSHYIVDTRGLVYHIVDGQATHVAGVASSANTSGDSNAVSLEQPNGLVALSNGDVLVADEGRKQILRVTADHKISVYGGNGQVGLATDGQAIAAAPLSGLVRMQLGNDGNIYMLQEGLLSGNIVDPANTPNLSSLMQPAQLLKVGSDGVVHVLSQVQGAVAGMNTFVLAGGVPYVRTMLGGVQRMGASGLTAVDLGPYGSPLAAFGGMLGSGTASLPASGAATGTTGAGGPGSDLVAGDASGTLWLFQTPQTLLTCLPPATPQVASTDTHVGVLAGAANATGRGVVDAQGRLCFVDAGKGAVWRFDPKAATFTCLAGPGGPIFAGSTADDSLDAPKDLCFAPDGSLLVLDTGHKQVKRIPADKL